jgi:hypothetical protein
MGMSTNIKGFVSPDDPTYKKHVKVLIACMEADIDELPKETAEYFGEKYPAEYLIEEKLEVSIPAKEYSAEMEDGYEIIVSEIPEGVHKIRFYNSY